MNTLTKKKVNTKAITRFRPSIRSRHPTHDILRSELPRMPFRAVIRLGSTTVMNNMDVEINTPEAVRNSASKLLMKQCFTEAGVKTAIWANGNTIDEIVTNLSSKIEGNIYPLIMKNYFGSRGEGNYLIESREKLDKWAVGKTITNYLGEVFDTKTREYRLHVTKNGCFYACRKMLKSETPTDKRWFRNDSNSTWILPDNEAFDRPVNWSVIEEECVKALNAVGLDIGACDVKVQSRLNKKGEERKEPDFFIIEINSAPSFGTITAQKYLEELPKLMVDKYSEKLKKEIVK
jgi:glutathione synthase/RimK-type ligase-like ATP-grasp enzyme